MPSLQKLCFTFLTATNVLANRMRSEDFQVTNTRDVFIVRVAGIKKSCRIDICDLICEGDQAEMNLCKAFPHLADIVDPTVTCIVVDECDIVCNDLAVANLCLAETQSETETPSEADLPPHRHLGNVEENVAADTETHLWPNAQVCYKIDNNVDATLALNAMEHWTERTGIEFIPCRSNAGECCAPCGEYIHFQRGNGCWSYLGRQPGLCDSGGQPLSLDTTCQIGSAIHEVGHALGLAHEHIRQDRNKYVRVLYDNVQEDYKHNFDINGVQNNELNGEYDYGSIMHYASSSFAIDDNKPNLVPIDASGRERTDVLIGQRNGLSGGDITTIAKLYDLQNLPIVGTMGEQSKKALGMETWMLVGILVGSILLFMTLSVCLYKSIRKCIRTTRGQQSVGFVPDKLPLSKANNNETPMSTKFSELSTPETTVRELQLSPSASILLQNSFINPATSSISKPQDAYQMVML